MISILWIAVVVLAVSQIVAIVRCFFALHLWTLVWTTVVLAVSAWLCIMGLLTSTLNDAPITDDRRNVAIVLIIVMLVVNIRAHIMASRS